MPEENVLDNKKVDGFGEIAIKSIRQEQVRLDHEEIATLIVEYQSGKTPAELSEKYGCHRITVVKILRRNGVEIRPRDHARVRQDADAIIAGYQAGKSTYTLAAELGCDHSTIAKILKEHGVIVSNRKAQQKLDIGVVIAMYEEMHTSKEIAQRFGVSPKAVIKCLREQGIKIRTRWDYEEK